MRVELVSDDILDSFSHGWTPVLVRTLVARYRQLKAAKADVDTFCEHACEHVQCLGEGSDIEWCTLCGATRTYLAGGSAALSDDQWNEWTRPRGPR